MEMDSPFHACIFKDMFLLNVDSASLLEMQAVADSNEGVMELEDHYCDLFTGKNTNVDYKLSSLQEELSARRNTRPQSQQEKEIWRKDSFNLKYVMPVLLHKCRGILSL